MSNIPKLRFPEFSGEWEEKRLDSLSLINPKPGDLPEVFSYIDLESVKNGVLLQEKIIKKEEAPSRAQRLLEEKDILFQTVRPYQRNNYFFNSKSPTVASTGYAQFRVNKNNYPSFLYQYLYTNNFVKNVLDRCSGTSFPAISTNDLLEICLHIPSLPEQQKIADFLSNVDSIITAETKILKTLQKKKKALMQKLFTRQLRFKSADGTDFPAWEEKKFSEVFIYHQTNTFSRNMLNYEEGDTYNIHYGDILVKFGSYIDFDNSKIPFINSDVTLNKFVSDSFLKDGDIIIADTAEDESAGKVSEVYNINNKKALSGLHTILCRPKQIFASKYLGYFMNSNVYHKQIVKLLVGTKVLSINKSVIADTIIQIPCLAEQQKIADCLSSLDSLIQTQQKVVTIWQQRKKALLQQMFV